MFRADVKRSALPAPMPGRCNKQGNNASHLEHVRGTSANTGRVNPMLLRQAPLRAVELRQAP
jgi:hypothetical protein